jgi:16S rRNA processing protein RimM
VIGTHGLRGAIKVWSLSDLPGRFQTLTQVWIARPGEPPVQRRVRSRRVDGTRVVLEIEGIDHIDVAERWVGAELTVPAADAPPLPEGQYRHYDLLGMTVYFEDGTVLGELADIRPTGANDVFIVRRGARELLVPAVRDVVSEVDVPGRRLVVRRVRGLFEDLSEDDEV